MLGGVNTFLFMRDDILCKNYISQKIILVLGSEQCSDVYAFVILICCQGRIVYCAEGNKRRVRNVSFIGFPLTQLALSSE